MINFLTHLLEEDIISTSVLMEEHKITLEAARGILKLLCRDSWITRKVQPGIKGQYLVNHKKILKELNYITK